MSRSPAAFASLWYLSITPKHESRDVAAGISSEHGRVRTLADFSPAEIAALEAKYGVPVKRTGAK